ncbi:tetratricopeptide repeat protein [Pedosphaera parvula]|uniref:Sel1 domain protein repeat-containing protein n=1 Tax=Pedosphaera parvula (strain Ellin514) TaxID=320771 RepID=B9XRF5_PEDPL|nr:tetratricopeptide repeat protein [Pedosphaera parvula]EEF57589.1 Sel1 domain protein repeat-containing protein [Pedosphaera parvula Ellin514]
MAKSWFSKLFSHAPKPVLEIAGAEANLEDAEVQFNRGMKFANLAEPERDYAQAAEWYLKAADQSHALAQFNLGMMYAHGQGVARDEVKATVWFEKAAMLGDAGAQHQLGMNHQRASKAGMDNHETWIEAYKWYQLAAAQGYKGSHQACESMALKMTREDVADGHNRVKCFLAKNANTVHK